MEFQQFDNRITFCAEVLFPLLHGTNFIRSNIHYIFTGWLDLDFPFSQQNAYRKSINLSIHNFPFK